MGSSSSDHIIKEIPGFIRLYQDGRYQKLSATEFVPAGYDHSSAVESKDVVISPDTPLSVRLYIPKIPESDLKKVEKLPLLIYYHGGGFIIGTTASMVYHRFLNLVAMESNVVIVSVNYRTAPDYPVLACFHDSWEAIKWVAQHVARNGPESWLNEYADFGKVFFGGDSAGATISHHMAIRIASENPCESNETAYENTKRNKSLCLQGIILLHPYFWGKDPIGFESSHPWKGLVDDIWMFVHPETSGLDDPLINPDKDPKVSGLSCSRVLVYVGEKDILKDRGWFYKEILERNGWTGDIEVNEDKEEGHVYFLFTPEVESACKLRKRICTFINT